MSYSLYARGGNKGKKMALVKPQGSTYVGASVRVKAGGGYKHHVVDWPLIVYFLCKKSVRGKPSSNDISEAKVVKLSET